MKYTRLHGYQFFLTYYPLTRIVLIIILFTFAYQITHAQVSAGEKGTVNGLLPRPVPKSPNVASLDKFGDYAVNYFSGVPEISIPIFEVSSGGLSVPITLSYHASGIKPSDVASWVGLGWSLSAGGNVSRNVLGKPDEEYFYSNALVQSPDPCSEYMRSSALSLIDTQPDVFSYSFPGSSGKFMLIEGGIPYLIPYAPVVVNTTFASNAFKKFEITNEHGVLHRFGTSATLATSREYTSSAVGGNPTLSATTAWHLMEMVAPNTDDQISFSYQNAGMCTMDDISYYINVADQCFGDASAACPDQPIVTNTVSINTSVNQQAVSVITYKKGKVEFVMGGLRKDQTKLRSLDRINIYSLVSGQYILLKTVKFIYSYYTTPNVSNSIRLKLDAVQFLDNSGNVVQNYKFSYFTNSFSWDGSNPRFCNERDLWGYFNGAYQNTDLINRKSVFVQPRTVAAGGWVWIGGAMDRSVNQLYIKEGVIKRIDFPAGGFTEFDFESNKYYDYFNAPGTPTLAGGLRVSSIVSSDGSGAPPVVKTYKYGSNGMYNTDIGIANFSQYSYNYKSFQSVTLDACAADMPGLKYMSTTYYSTSAYTSDAFDSSPVLYPNVTEYFGDPAGNNIGRVEYEFDKGLPQTDNDQIVPTSSRYYRDSYFWKRGKLTHKTTYDNQNNKLAETIIDYSGIHASDKIIGLGAFQYRLRLGPHCISPGECPSGIDPSDYRSANFFQHSGAWLESNVTSYSYNPGDVSKYVMTTTSKTYHLDKLQILQTTTSGANNDLVISVNKYPFQLTSSPLSAGNALGIQMLKTKNILSNPIETYTYRQNSDGTNSRVISGQITTYRQNDANKNYVVPDQVYLWESSQTVPTSSYSPVVTNGSNRGLTMDPNQKNRITMLGYDSYGNVLSVSKKNDVVVSYLYGYNHALPIAEVKNAMNTSDTKEIFFESFEENNSGGVVTNASLSHAGKKYLGGAYTTAFIPPPGKSYKLEYWFLLNGKWNYNSKVYTGAGMILNDGIAIDDVRIYPADAQMKSYTYDPVLGITSVLDENGVLQVYEYDKFGRLMTMKDNDQNLLQVFKYHYHNPK